MYSALYQDQTTTPPSTYTHMCYFSFLVEPFYYTLILSTLHALISHLGYARAAELVYSTFMAATFGRGDHKKFMGKWRELKTAKSEVKKVSAQVRSGLRGFGVCF